MKKGDCLCRGLLYGVLFAALPCAQGSSIFNFENDAQGTSTRFTDTNNGISATFISNGDPGGFEVVPSFFSSLTGNVLLDPGPAGFDGLTLIVSFSQQLSDVSLNFAINNLSPSDTLTLAAYEGNTPVGSTTVLGSVPAGGFFFPEGIAALSGGVFDTILLSSTGLDFAVDNLAVDPASAPEPGSFFAVLCSMLCAGGVAAWRRRRITVRA